MSDADRRAILGRRERFLRAALATAGVALSACNSGSKTCDGVRRSMPDPVARVVGCEPAHVCLSIAIVDAGSTPCLSPPISDASTATDAGVPVKPLAPRDE